MLAVCLAAQAVASRPADGAVAVFVDGERRQATLEGFSFHFQRPEEASTTLSGGTPMDAGGLVRWGTPVPAPSGLWLAMRDGSTLAADGGWTSSARLRADADSVAIRRSGEWVEVPRGSVRVIVLEATPPLRASNLEPAEADLITLVGDSTGVRGDRIEGRVGAIDERSVLVSLLDVETPVDLDRVARIDLASGDSSKLVQGTGCLVGLADGSLLIARRIAVRDHQWSIELNSGAVFSGASDQLVFLQPLDGRVRYLSDSAPLDYRHTPYFRMVWPLGRDQRPRGEALLAAGSHYAKGLGVHAAARVVYPLTASDARFQASLAVADDRMSAAGAGAGQGSVVFRVYAVRQGELTELYQSPVVRAGEAPLPIDIDVSGSVGLALVVDFADGGDAGDDAMWLDARIVTAGR